jgi:hypothetical protein
MKLKTGSRKLLVLSAISAVGMSCLMVGCEREVSHTESTKVNSDGTVKSKEQTVTEKPDGTVTKTETKKTEKP